MEAIHVNEITDLAGYHRSTFYPIFLSENDLADNSQNAIYFELLASGDFDHPESL